MKRFQFKLESVLKHRIRLEDLEKKELAEQILFNLKTDLEQLGLSINQKKTIISKVGNFYAEFK